MHSLHTIVAYSIFASAGVAALAGIGGTLYEHFAARRHIKRRLRQIQERAGR